MGCLSQLRWSRICLQGRRPQFHSWVGKIPWRRERLPAPVFWPGWGWGRTGPARVSLLMGEQGTACLARTISRVAASPEALPTQLSSGCAEGQRPAGKGPDTPPQTAAKTLPCTDLTPRTFQVSEAATHMCIPREMHSTQCRPTRPRGSATGRPRARQAGDRREGWARGQ